MVSVNIHYVYAISIVDIYPPSPRSSLKKSIIFVVRKVNTQVPKSSNRRVEKRRRNLFKAPLIHRLSNKTSRQPAPTRSSLPPSAQSIGGLVKGEGEELKDVQAPNEDELVSTTSVSNDQTIQPGIVMGNLLRWGETLPPPRFRTGRDHPPSPSSSSFPTTGTDPSTLPARRLINFRGYNRYLPLPAEHQPAGYQSNYHAHGPHHSYMPQPPLGSSSELTTDYLNHPTAYCGPLSYDYPTYHPHPFFPPTQPSIDPSEYYQNIPSHPNYFETSVIPEPSYFDTSAIPEPSYLT